jgi:hypothetical protein
MSIQEKRRCSMRLNTANAVAEYKYKNNYYENKENQRPTNRQGANDGATIEAGKYQRVQRTISRRSDPQVGTHPAGYEGSKIGGRVMKTYQEHLERAHQLQLRAIREKKTCSINVNIHASSGCFAINVLNGKGGLFADAYIEEYEDPEDNYNERQLDGIERTYELMK